MLTVFLDANILFSAAYKPDSRLLVLWSLPEVTLATSAYAVEEARRNLPDPTQKATLDRLVKDLRVLLEIRADILLPISVDLPEKDRPILTGAIQIKADVLLTGDVKHFGPLFGKRIKGDPQHCSGGVRILTPALFLASRKSP